jgi:hypothetical protein
MADIDFGKFLATTGYTIDEVAKLFGYDRDLVYGWYEGTAFLPREVGAWAEEALADHHKTVETSKNVVLEMIEQTGAAPRTVALTFWRNQDEYDAHGRDRGYYTVVNARSKAVARELEAMGIECDLRYFDEGAIATPGSNY